MVTELDPLDVLPRALTLVTRPGMGVLQVILILILILMFIIYI